MKKHKNPKPLEGRPGMYIYDGPYKDYNVVLAQVMAGQIVLDAREKARILHKRKRSTYGIGKV
jgi:hypothetical protein